MSPKSSAVNIHPDLPEFHDLRTAITQVRIEDEPHWGRMNAGQMLEHMARFNEVYLGRIPTPGLVRLLGRAFGGFFIRKFARSSPWEMPRGMGTMPQARMDRVMIDDDDFEEVRARAISTLDEIAAHDGTWDHPIYGKIDAEVAKAMARGHTAHHLHQFGKVGPDPE